MRSTTACNYLAPSDNPRRPGAAPTLGTNMKNTRTPRIHRGTIGGEPIVRVEMINLKGVFATVAAEDWDAWVAAGRSQRWLLNSSGRGQPSYVRAVDLGVPGQLVTVARELHNPGKGCAVRYRDDDRLNLRRSNLYVASAKRGAFSDHDTALAA
jgi:hypothetical protein